jgi:hypothetical protein
MTGGGKAFGSTVNYLFIFPTPTFKRDLSTAEIGNLKGPGPIEKVKIPGLTVSKFHVEADYRMDESRIWFGDGVKVWVEGVTVHFGFNEMTVYITREYADGSCPYRETYAHEMEHVAAHKKVWTEYQDKLRDAVRSAPAIPVRSSPGRYATYEEGRDKIGKAISAALDPVFDAFKQADEEAQEVLDTRENYEGLRQKCNDW